MKRPDFILYLVIGLVFGLSGCGVSKLDNIKWTHPEKDMKAYYEDDAQCLEQANNILFSQLKSAEAKRTRKSSIAKIGKQDFSDQVCKSNNQRNRIHYDCMLKRGWVAESN